MAGKKDVVRDVVEIAVEFVLKRKGVWEHEEWEAFVKKAGKAGAVVDDGGQATLGSILESVKCLYHRLDEPAPAKAEKKAPVPKTPKPVKAEKAVKPKPAAKTPRKKVAEPKPEE